MLEKLFALSDGGFEKKNGIYINRSGSLIRVLANGDGDTLISLSDGKSVVITDTEAEMPKYSAKAYALYRCDRLIPKAAHGKMISGEDRPETAELLHTMMSSLGLSAERAETEAFVRAHSNELYLWEDDGICALARIALLGKKYARINTVVTSPEKRGRGYAGALVSALASKIMAEGLIPTVLADESNPVSNKLYRSLGFTQDGVIFEYTPQSIIPRENAIFYLG